MTPSTVAVVAAWSYGLAAVGYLAFGLRVALGWTRSTRAALLLAATLTTVLWAACEAAIALTSSPIWFPWANAFDTLRYAIWFAFVGVLIAGGSEQSTWPFSRWVVRACGFRPDHKPGAFKRDVPGASVGLTTEREPHLQYVSASPFLALY